MPTAGMNFLQSSDPQTWSLCAVTVEPAGASALTSDRLPTFRQPAPRSE